MKTLFAPWKGDVQTARNIALSDQIKLWESNLASRVIGFLIRIVIILVSLLIIGASAIVFVFGLFIWILTPFLIIILPVVALTR